MDHDKTTKFAAYVVKEAKAKAAEDADTLAIVVAYCTQRLCNRLDLVAEQLSRIADSAESITINNSDRN